MTNTQPTGESAVLLQYYTEQLVRNLNAFRMDSQRMHALIDDISIPAPELPIGVMSIVDHALTLGRKLHDNGATGTEREILAAMVARQVSAAIRLVSEVDMKI